MLFPYIFKSASKLVGKFYYKRLQGLVQEYKNLTGLASLLSALGFAR